MKRIVVLGAGLVGSAMAIDLSKNFEVTSVDIYNDGTMDMMIVQGNGDWYGNFITNGMVSDSL